MTVVGTRDGDGPNALGMVTDCEVDAFDRLYVLECVHARITLLWRDGASIRTIGALGGRPGEFRGAADR